RRDAAGRSRRDRVHPGGRRDGPPASPAPDVRRAVPPGVVPHARGTGDPRALRRDVPMNRVVTAQDVARRFGDRVALDGFDLELERGEILGFVGPNGAGKSTFLRILIGLVQRDAGHVAVFGRDPRRDGLRIRERTAYLPGETSVYHHMTGAELLAFTRAFHRKRLELPAVAHELFALPLDRKLRQYSAGMKQKLALQAVLEADVDLYLLDEPDRALDATARLQLRELLEWLRGRGKTAPLK